MKNEFKIITNLLPVQSRVLDVGCGDGTLIEALTKQKNIETRGIELEENKVKQCISKGLSVIQGNAETELGQFPDKDLLTKYPELHLHDYQKQARARRKIGHVTCLASHSHAYHRALETLLLQTLES